MEPEPVVARGPPIKAPEPGRGADVPPQASAPAGSVEVPAEESEAGREGVAQALIPGKSLGRSLGLRTLPDPMGLPASAAAAIDVATGKILAAKNADKALPMASITKLMMATVALEAGQNMDEMLTIDEQDVDELRHSRSRLSPGVALTREEALRLALMSSENRAAHALARYYPGGVAAMVAAMNAKAKALGLSATVYDDPTGLSGRNRSTAADLARLAMISARNPTLAQYTTARRRAETLGGKSLLFKNSNLLVGSPGWEVSLQKTGYVVEAGRCMVLVARVAGRDGAVAILDADSSWERAGAAERLRRHVASENGWDDSAFDRAREQAVASAKLAKAASKAAAKTRKAMAKKRPKGAAVN